MRMYYFEIMFRLRSEKFGHYNRKKENRKSYTKIAERNRRQGNRIERHVFVIENMFVLNVKKMYNITLKWTRPHFTYKNRKYVRPQLTWGSSLPNQLFQDLEITFNFAHPCSFPFPLIFTVFCSITLILFTLFTLSYFFSSPSPFFSLIHYPISQFHLTDLYINYYQSYIQCCLMLVIQFSFSVSSALIICCHNHILYNEELFYFP